jgi:transcriptional regulator with XRE-family HTH domain
MTTSAQMEFLSEILEWEPIPHDTLVYFRERLRRRLHSAVLDAFAKRSNERELTQKELAIRTHRSRVVINRWLSTASNLTLDSISDLMVGLGMDFDAFPFTPIENTVAAKEEARRAEAPNLLSMPRATKATVDDLIQLDQTPTSLMQLNALGAESATSVQSTPTSAAIPDSIQALQTQTVSERVADFSNYNATASGPGLKNAA